MKFDIREIQALKKSGAKYNQYDEAVSRYLLALKIEGYDTSNIKNYEQLLELMNDYNVVYDKNIEGSIQSDIEKAVKEGISINKELLDDILMEYDKYLSVKQVKEKIRDDTYKTYQKIINNEKANKFAKDVAEKELENLKDTVDNSKTEELKSIIEEETKTNLDNKTKKKSLKDILVEIQENKERELNKKTKKIEEILREIIDPEGEEKRKEFLKKNADITEALEREREKLRENNPDIVEKLKESKRELIKNNKDIALRFEEDKKNLRKDYGVLNKKGIFDKIRSENPELVEKLIKKQVEILVNKAKEINPEVNVSELKEDLSSFYNQALDDGVSFKELSSEIKAKIGIKDKESIEKLSNKILTTGGYEEISKDPFFLKEFQGSILGQENVLKKAIDIYYNSEDSDFKDKLVNIGLSENEADILYKRINLQTDNYLKQNEEEAKLLRRDAFGKRLSDGFMGANEGFNMEQEIAFRKYRNFLANTFYPEDGFFESIGTKDWLSGYKEIKGDLIKSGLKLPYEMKEVADADNWARAFENPAILHQAVREQKTAQFWNNFNERTGGAFKNFGSNFQSGFNSFATQARNGIGGAFNQFFGRKEGGGASPFMSGLKNIGNTLGQGAQNGARNALQGLNNGIGSMMKGLGGKLGGFGAKGGGMAAKGGLAAAKGLGALFAGGGGGIAIAVILIIILFVFILIYSGSLNQNLSSSLLPGAYGYQESDEDDEGGGEIVDGVCFVTRNGIKMPIFEPTTGGGRISTDTDGKRYDLAKKYPDFVGTTPSQYCYALENKFDSRVLPLLIKMIDDAKKDGIILGIDSMYRSYERQQVLYNAYVEYLSTGFCPSSECSCTCEPADPPGSSAHHTGRALDFNWWWTDGGSRYDWIKNNGYKYGFYQTTSEPWHWEYNPKLEAGESCEVETN